MSSTNSQPSERDFFENAIWIYYTNLKRHGWSAPEEGDFTREALFWREESGRYGVRQIEAAWMGWQLRAQYVVS